MLKKLTALANRLDHLKFTREADLLDEVIVKLAHTKLPHDEDDELSEEFEKYLASEPEEYEEPHDEMTEEEARLQIAALSQMLDRDDLPEEKVELIARTLMELLKDVQPEGEGEIGGVSSLTGETLPIGEA